MLKRPDVGEHLVSSIESKVSCDLTAERVDNLKRRFLGVVEEVQSVGKSTRIVVRVDASSFKLTNTRNMVQQSPLSTMITEARTSPQKYGMIAVDLILLNGVNNAPPFSDKSSIKFEHEIDFVAQRGRTIMLVSIGNRQFVLKCIEPSPMSIQNNGSVVTKTQKEVDAYKKIQTNRLVSGLFVNVYAYGRLWVYKEGGVCFNYEVVLLEKMSDLDLEVAISEQVGIDVDVSFGWLANGVTQLKKLHELGYVHGDSRPSNLMWRTNDKTQNLAFIDPEKTRQVKAKPEFNSNLFKLLDINLLLLFSYQMAVVSGGVFFKSADAHAFSERLRIIGDQFKDRSPKRYFLYKFVTFFSNFDAVWPDYDKLASDVQSGVFVGKAEMIKKIDLGAIYSHLSNPAQLRIVVETLGTIYKSMLASMTEIQQSELAFVSKVLESFPDLGPIEGYVQPDVTGYDGSGFIPSPPQPPVNPGNKIQRDFFMSPEGKFFYQHKDNVYYETKEEGVEYVSNSGAPPPPPPQQQPLIPPQVHFVPAQNMGHPTGPVRNVIFRPPPGPMPMDPRGGFPQQFQPQPVFPMPHGQFPPHPQFHHGIPHGHMAGPPQFVHPGLPPPMFGPPHQPPGWNFGSQMSLGAPGDPAAREPGETWEEFEIRRRAIEAAGADGERRAVEAVFDELIRQNGFLDPKTATPAQVIKIINDYLAKGGPALTGRYLTRYNELQAMVRAAAAEARAARGPPADPAGAAVPGADEGYFVPFKSFFASKNFIPASHRYRITLLLIDDAVKKGELILDYTQLICYRQISRLALTQDREEDAPDAAGAAAPAAAAGGAAAAGRSFVREYGLFGGFFRVKGIDPNADPKAAVKAIFEALNSNELRDLTSDELREFERIKELARQQDAAAGGRPGGGAAEPPRGGAADRPFEDPFDKLFRERRFDPSTHSPMEIFEFVRLAVSTSEISLFDQRDLDRYNQFKKEADEEALARGGASARARRAPGAPGGPAARGGGGGWYDRATEAVRGAAGALLPGVFPGRGTSPSPSPPSSARGGGGGSVPPSQADREMAAARAAAAEARREAAEAATASPSPPPDRARQETIPLPPGQDDPRRDDAARKMQRAVRGFQSWRTAPPPTNAAQFSYPVRYTEPTTNFIYTQYFDAPNHPYVDPVSGLSSWYWRTATAQDGTRYRLYKNFDPYRNPSQL